MPTSKATTFCYAYNVLMNGPNDGMPGAEELAHILIKIDPDAKLRIIEDHGLEITFSDGSHASITAQTMH